MQGILQFESDFVIQFQNLPGQNHLHLDLHLMVDLFLRYHLF